MLYLYMYNVYSNRLKCMLQYIITHILSSFYYKKSINYKFPNQKWHQKGAFQRGAHSRWKERSGKNP